VYDVTTEAVLAWVKTLPTKPEHYYCGMLNSKKDKSFGIYQLKDQRSRDISLGGITNTKTAVKGISILVHWTQSTRETEDIAAALYNNLATIENIVIGGKRVNYIQLLHNESIDVGADENGICERVIEFIIHYERS
jgi:hypothetical protein